MSKHFEKERIIMKKLLTVVTVALAAALLLASCGKKENKTVTVAATSSPHAEILEQVKGAMKDKGFDLVVKVVDDYVTPNTATESGDVDANYFQHVPYLDSFNEENGTHLVSVAGIHYEPFAIYKGTSDSLDLEEGAKIAVPNDPTNEARALQLLAANDLIEVKEGAGLTATKNDITANPLNLDIVEMEAALLPTVLDDVAVAVINGNYALGAGLDVNQSLASEDPDSEAAQTFVNVLVVKEGHENDEAIKALKEVLLSDAVKDYINNTYNGAVLPIF